MRGVEVKNSRSDFKNGFIHVGCDYNYLLYPKGLIKRSEVDTKIGLIEVDLDQFKVILNRSPFSGYYFTGVTLLRRPRRTRIPSRALQYSRGQIEVSLTNQVARWLKRELGVVGV